MATRTVKRVTLRLSARLFKQLETGDEAVVKLS